LVTAATGAVDEQRRLVTVCVQVAAAVVLGAEVWSCRAAHHKNLFYFEFLIIRQNTIKDITPRG